MFYHLTLENETGQQIDLSRTQNIMTIVNDGDEVGFTLEISGGPAKNNKDYFVGDYVTVEHRRFGLRQNKIKLIGMIESFDRNGRNLTPTFKEV